MTSGDGAHLARGRRVACGNLHPRAAASLQGVVADRDALLLGQRLDVRSYIEPWHEGAPSGPAPSGDRVTKCKVETFTVPCMSRSRRESTYHEPALFQTIDDTKDDLPAMVMAQAALERLAGIGEGKDFVNCWP